ncbi:Ig-like domain-containing protein [Roseivivax marinus]|uniref:Ig-like domain-containing protein n=1 Tax=Roseivivax marinus TaxID=1379903 RepID=UPI001587B24A|nr:Ig-like domain-containing protein [Roseivivax marinus]
MTLFAKAQGRDFRDLEGSVVELGEPSVLQLHIGPEEVARFDRDGNDLVLVLKDGSVLRLVNFFVVTEQGRHDLTFVDENGVTWWGQYGEVWDGFDISEIEHGTAFAPVMPQGLGLLGGGLAAAALAYGPNSLPDDPNSPPEVTADSQEIPEDTPVDGQVTAEDVDGDTLTYEVTDGPANGTVEIDTATGEYTYTPNPDYNGADSFDVTVTDGNGGSDTVTVGITVTPVNDAPVATPDSQETPEDTPVDGQVTAEDVDGDTLTYEVTDGPANGTVEIDTATGEYTYTPNPDYNGADSFDVTVTDGNGGSDTVTVGITVTPVNDAATIGGELTGAVEEAGGVENGTPGTQTASGTASVTDVDEEESVFREPNSLEGTYGAFTFDAETGEWVYTLDDTRSATEALVEGQEITDALDVTSLDGTVTETITVTVTGQNDAAQVTNDTGSMTEDGPLDEEMLTTSGSVEVIDKDTGEAELDPAETRFDSGSHGGASPLGTLTVNADGTWSYQIDNSLPAVQSLPEDGTLTETFIVTSADGTATGTITVTVNGTNDQPTPADDASIIGMDDVAVLDVVENDTDVDAGETETLQVTFVDSQAIAPGGSITLAGGQGTVSLSGQGELSFTPADGLTGQVTIGYTVDDGSGTGNASASADWVVNVAGVTISDNAGPTEGAEPDGVLASVDDLTAVEISGFAAVGGSVTSIVITDGLGESVTLTDVPVGADGTYFVTADLSDLDDGTLTVTANVQDGNGNPATTQDTILLDTVTEVTIDPVLIEEGKAPVITGIAEEGSSVTVNVNGTDHEATVDGSGNWSVTLPDPITADEVTVTATGTDAYGNTDTDDRTITEVTVADEEAGEPVDILVSESALDDGSQEGSGADAATSSFALGGDVSNLDSVVIGGTVSGGELSSGTTFTIAELQSVETDGPLDPVTTEYGTLTITGFDSGTGEVSYTYTLSGNTEDHSDESANDVVSETINIAVIEQDGDTWVDQLNVGIVDDAPETPVDDPALSVTEGGAAIGSATTEGANLLANDTLGADGGRVNTVFYTDRDGNPAQVTLTEGGSEEVDTQYGTLTVGSDGTWSYEPLSAADHQQPANDTTLDDSFTYNTVDGDDDVSAGVGTQSITVGDTVAEFGTPEDAVVDEANLPSGTDPDVSELSQSGSLNLSPGQDGFGVQLTTDSAPAGLTSGGDPIRYTLSEDGLTLTADTGEGTAPVFTVTLTDPTNADAGYTFDLLGPLDHDGASLDLVFGVEVTDADGDTDPDQFTVAVGDDAPVTEIERTVDEDSDGFTVNTSADANADNTGISQGGTALTGIPDSVTGEVVYDTDHGTVTVAPDGSVSYVPDDNFSGEEPFEIVTLDDQAVESRIAVTANVTSVADPAEVTVVNAEVGTVEDTEVLLGLDRPVITDDGTGTGNNARPERIGAITLSGLPEVAILGWAGQTFTVDATGEVSIELTDPDLSVTGLDTDISMTADDFENLEVTPPANSSANFEVTYDVTSYEVDDTGEILVAEGADSSETVSVFVQAATDPATLTFDTGVDADSVDNATDIVYSGSGGNTVAEVTLAEDTAVDLADFLAANFTDLDESEQRSITITNGSGEPILVNGQTVTAGGTITLEGGSLSTSTTGFPQIEIGGTDNFAGDLDNITVTLNAQDYDADGYLDEGTPTGDGVAGLPEADPTDNSVTLNLRVTPVADDVVVEDVTTEEDNAVDFLRGVRLGDFSGGATDGGSELITAVSFDIPDGWEVSASDVVNGASNADITEVDGTYTIAFTDGTQAEREEFLDGFTITPPDHSSSDATITLRVSSTDEAEVGGNTVTNTVTDAEHELTITVTPVAERVDVDSDSDEDFDVTMTEGFEYSTAALEDEWFVLNSDGFNLQTGWSNEDAGEATFARLTPELIEGDGSAADATGSMFQWVEDGDPQSAVYDGVTPIDVPVSALGSLQFKAAEDFSGAFRIRVQAYTVDEDDDGGTTVEAVSGEAFLENLVVEPVADEVTLALASRARGNEDNDIPLNIRPTSSDPSETFDVTIDDIPEGAVLTYNGTVQPVEDGSVTIPDFDAGLPLTLRPPLDSNENFTLQVSAQSVDRVTIDGGVLEDRSVVESLSMNVEVRGVADPAIVDLTPQTYEEQAIDSGAATIALTKLVAIELGDTDDSETLTVRITDLPEGFDLTHGTLLTGTEATGEDRVWIIRESQLETVEITVPQNFSGEVTFGASPVTTENDGASRTGTQQPVTFTVTPSPEATVTTAASIVEDELQSLDFGIVHQNGDTDEVIDAVRIAVGQTEEQDFTLFVGGQPISDLTPVDDGGTLYYELTPEQAETLAAQGAENLDGVLGSFELEYRITDPGDGTVDPVTSDWQSSTFEITGIPVTDQPDLTLAGFELGGDNGTVDGTDITVSAPGEQVTMTLNVNTADTDGSEHVVRVLLDNVPNGVTVEGAELVGQGTWLLVYENADALPINEAGGIDLPVVLSVSSSAGGQDEVPISVTVQTQDRGNEADSPAEVLQDSETWTLTTDFTFEEGGEPPAIEAWVYNGAAATEDLAFTLNSVVTGTVSVSDPAASVLTVTITDLPPGTIVDGMVQTSVDGEPVWTASVTTNPGDDTAAVQAQLDALLDSITLQVAPDANDNNLAEDFTLNATLTTALAGGGAPNEEALSNEIPVQPVTDEANVSIALGAADADGRLTETDSEIPLTLTVTNPADGDDASIEGGEVYLQVSGTNGLGSGTLTVDGVEYEPTTITGQEGITDGDYYVIPGAEMGVPLDMVFTPDTVTAGEVTVDAWVRNIETGGETLTSAGSTILPIEISNDGVTVDAEAPFTGPEAADSTPASLIGLDLALSLVDDDGSEVITTVLLPDLPEGFLVYTGADADTSTMAVNAGGDGTTNTWLLAAEGQPMPEYIGILPPQNWSGTLEDLTLTVISGETALSEDRVDRVQIGDLVVTPVANGVTLDPTNSFGTEGRIIPMNLNASLADLGDASVPGAADGSTETVTLQIEGLGEHASLYVGTTLLTEGVSYDAGTGTYTVTGLTQDQIDTLGFRQASTGLTDQDGTTGGLQLKVTARSVDGPDESDPVEGFVTVNQTAQQGSAADNTLIWTGELINGRGGFDTVLFRQGESLTGTELGDNLRNIEVLELGIDGANGITDLTPDQVFAMTSGPRALTVTGDAEDSLSLSGDWADNGDGTWTGTANGGQEVTLTAQDVAVTPPPAPFAAFSMMSFGAGGGEIGLSGIDSLEAEAEEPAQEPAAEGDGTPGAPEEEVSYETLVAEGGSDEDLSDLLPEEDSDRTGGTGSSEPGDMTGSEPASSLEDELQPGAEYAV